MLVQHNEDLSYIQRQEIIWMGFLSGNELPVTYIVQAKTGWLSTGYIVDRVSIVVAMRYLWVFKSII